MKNITVPELGESIIEGTLTSWLIKEGDSFESGDNLAEIETEKITIEIPAQTSGKLTKIITPEGSTVNVGQSIAEISENTTTEQIPKPETSQIEEINEEKQTILESITLYEKVKIINEIIEFYFHEKNEGNITIQ